MSAWRCLWETAVIWKLFYFPRLFPLISLRPDKGHFQIGDMYPQNCPFSLTFWPVQAALFLIKFSVVSVHLCHLSLTSLFLSISVISVCLCSSLSYNLCYLCLCLSSSLSISPLLPAPSHPAFKSISPFFPFKRSNHCIYPTGACWVRWVLNHYHSWLSLPP